MTTWPHKSSLRKYGNGIAVVDAARRSGAISRPQSINAICQLGGIPTAITNRFKRLDILDPFINLLEHGQLSVPDAHPLVRLLFNLDEDLTHFCPQSIHFLQETYYLHPDDADAFRTIVRAIGEHFPLENRVNRKSLYSDARLAGSYLAVGNPVGNPIARFLLDYYAKTDRPLDGFIRDSQPIYHLPFDLVLEREEIAKVVGCAAECRRVVEGKPYFVPNWFLKRSVTKDGGENYLIPSVLNVNNDLISDYLTILRLPNSMDVSSFDKHSSIVIIAGLHGVGTRAIRLLLNDRLLLDLLWSLVKNMEYWQAIVPVTEIDNSGKSSAPIRLGRDVIVGEIEIDQVALTRCLDGLGRSDRPVAVVRVSSEQEMHTDSTKLRRGARFPEARIDESIERDLPGETNYATIREGGSSVEHGALARSLPEDRRVGVPYEGTEHMAVDANVAASMKREDSERRTFSFAGYCDKHAIGGATCATGACGKKTGYFTGEYPKRCRCGGWIHANIDWASFAHSYWGPEEQCDRCGENFEVDEREKAA